ncbi:hypothetical protein BJF85_16735 [Saccharomonospora sp. CUA-673]|uniref:hypothetical protein n=1 Tax=Saccharomonospora sp. CUA-673 TaxID=1904969 RepID=UPI00096736BC|nr:hypothetical protein [Saccharomonospora sp. CUA-673]OLT46489.1 hypothetical protein BJF85_16735 [Saccharomonospora sp. CUA-673]
MFEFKVQPVDGGDEYRVTADSRDIYVWEKTGKGRSLATLRDNPTMAANYEIAYQAARRQRLFVGTMAEFAELNVLDFTEDGEDEDPTHGEA